MGWIHLGEGKDQSDLAFVDTEMNRRISLRTGIFLSVGHNARWRCRLRYCATSQKFAGSIPYGVIKIFN